MIIKKEPIYKVNDDCDEDRLHLIEVATNEYIKRGEECVVCLGHSGDDPDMLSVSAGVATNFTIEGEVLYADLEIDELWEDTRELKSRNKKSVELWVDNVISSVSLLCRNRPQLELSTIKYQAPDRDCAKETYMYPEEENKDMNTEEIKQLFAELLEHSELKAKTSEIMQSITTLQESVRQHEDTMAPLLAPDEPEQMEMVGEEEAVTEEIGGEALNEEGEIIVDDPETEVVEDQVEAVEEAVEGEPLEKSEKDEEVKEEVGEVVEAKEEVKEEEAEVVEAKEDVKEEEKEVAEVVEEKEVPEKSEADGDNAARQSAVETGFEYEKKEHPDLTNEQILKIVADHLLEDANYYSKPEKSDMASANNTYIPTNEKPKKTKYQMSQDLVAEYQEKLIVAEQEKSELVQKYQYESRKNELLELSNDYNFDPKQEIEMVSKLNDEQWDNHKKIIVTRYQKSPAGRTVDPVSSLEDRETQIHKIDKVQDAIQMATREGIDFKSALERLK